MKRQCSGEQSLWDPPSDAPERIIIVLPTSKTFAFGSVPSAFASALTSGPKSASLVRCYESGMPHEPKVKGMERESGNQNNTDIQCFIWATIDRMAPISGCVSMLRTM